MPRRKILLEQQNRPSPPAAGKQRPKTQRRFSLRLWLADVAVLVPLWLLLVDQASWTEAGIGIAAAALAALATEAARSIGFARFYPRWQWLIPAVRVPGEVLRDCGVLTAVLAGRIVRRRRERGFFKAIPFTAGGAGARSAARRAMAITLGTLSPNSCVLDIEPYSGFALLHQIRESPAPSFVRRMRNE